MPEISRFFGIVIRMYMEAGAQHATPHFHAYYQNAAAVFSIFPIEAIAGSLPRRQTRLVEAWAELHQDDTASFHSPSKRLNEKIAGRFFIWSTKFTESFQPESSARTSSKLFLKIA